METLYICGEADISRDESTILIKTHGVRKRVPIEAIRHIVVMSDSTLTTKFLALSVARSSLALDLAEPFKPVVVDRQIFAIVRKNILADGWFEPFGMGMGLSISRTIVE